MKRKFYSWDECMNLRELKVVFKFFECTLLVIEFGSFVHMPEMSHGEDWGYKLNFLVSLVHALKVPSFSRVAAISRRFSVSMQVLKKSWNPDCSWIFGQGLTTCVNWPNMCWLSEQSLCKLNHPNIVKLKEVIRENNEFYFVFAYLVKLLFFVSW